MATPSAHGSSQARGFNQPVPQLQQHRIRAMSVTCTTAHGKAGSLTYWVRPGIEPTSSWILVGFITAETQRNSLKTFFYCHFTGVGGGSRGKCIGQCAVFNQKFSAKLLCTVCCTQFLYKPLYTCRSIPYLLPASTALLAVLPHRLWVCCCWTRWSLGAQSSLESSSSHGIPAIFYTVRNGSGVDWWKETAKLESSITQSMRLSFGAWQNIDQLEQCH